MPRVFREFTGEDVVRFFNENLRFEEQRVVLIYFWALSPKLTIPGQTDIFGAVLDLIGVIPGAGNIISALRLTANTIDAILEIDEFFRALKNIEEEEEAIAEFVDENRTLRGELEELLRERNGLLRDIVELEGLLISRESEVDVLRRQNDELRDSNRRLRGELEQCQTELDQILGNIPVETPLTPSLTASQINLLEEIVLFLRQTIRSTGFVISPGRSTRARNFRLRLLNLFPIRDRRGSVPLN